MSDTVNPDAPARPMVPAERLGAELRVRRESLGWKLPDLAQSLRIRQTYLEAIEAGRIGDLPGTTYALGFVRAYASALGLQGEQIAGRFRAESAETTARPALSFPAPVPQRGVPAGALMLLGLLILAGAYSGWYYVSEHQRTPPETVPPIPDRLLPHAADKPAPSPQVASLLPTASPPTQPAPVASVIPPAAAPQPSTPAPSLAPHPPSASPTPAPAPAPLAAPAPSLAPPLPIATLPATPTPVAPPTVPAGSNPPGTQISIKATAPAWVTIRPKSGGPTVFNRLMRSGDTWSVPPNTAGMLLLTTGNAGATHLTVDGAQVVNLGPDGTVFRDLPLDAGMLKSGHLPPSRPPRPKPAVPVDDGEGAAAASR